MASRHGRVTAAVDTADAPAVALLSTAPAWSGDAPGYGR